MKQLFTSATLRLTGWYLLILACISLLFSIIVYQVATGEIERRLTHYQDKSWTLIQPSPENPEAALDLIRQAELRESKASIVGILLYMNLAILTVGGALSYLMARRTLSPIEEAHEAQARFISDASHELRTPLASMTTELEVALSDPSLKKNEMKAILNSNLEEVQRLTKLSSMLLALSSGRTSELSQHVFDFAASIAHIAKRFDNPPGRIQLNLSESNHEVIGNQSAIEELLAILIDNALKYSYPDSIITISSAVSGHRLTIRVINKGDGIATNDLPRIFDRFYRADTTRSGKGGHGLGLALAKQIDAVHKTGLAVTSIPGDTTEFSFSLPISRSQAVLS